MVIHVNQAMALDTAEKTQAIWGGMEAVPNRERSLLALVPEELWNAVQVSQT